jgi:hypothetical protein
MSFTEVSDEMAATERAEFDAHHTFAAQMPIAARNFVREQTAIAKPFDQWLVENVITAVRIST